jgi:hypothetical protein
MAQAALELRPRLFLMEAAHRPAWPTTFRKVA